MPENISCGLILLAAGASTRMGRPKQLLPMYGNRPLLRHTVEAAMTGPVSPIIVVLGAHAKDIAPCLVGLPVQTVINADWSTGMSSSLRRGMEALTQHQPAVDHVIIALADQPDIPAGYLTKLIDTQRTTGQPIVASECEGVCGPPVLFTSGYFSKLCTLQGDAGARALLKSYPEHVATVPLPNTRDLDTPADYKEYLEQISPRITQIDADKL